MLSKLLYVSHPENAYLFEIFPELKCVHTNLISETALDCFPQSGSSYLYPKFCFNLILLFNISSVGVFFKVMSGQVKNYFFIFTHSKVNVQCQKSRFIRKKYFSFDATIMIYWRVPLPNLGNPSDKCLYYITFQFF